MITLVIKENKSTLEEKEIIVHSSFRHFINNMLKIVETKSKNKDIKLNDIFKDYCKSLTISNYKLKGIYDIELWIRENLQKYIVKENISVEVITKREKSVFYF